MTTTEKGRPRPLRLRVSIETASSHLGSALSVDVSAEVDSAWPGERELNVKKRGPFPSSFLLLLLRRRSTSMGSSKRKKSTLLRVRFRPLALRLIFFPRLNLTPFCTIDRNLPIQRGRHVSGPEKKGKEKLVFVREETGQKKEKNQNRLSTMPTPVSRFASGSSRHPSVAASAPGSARSMSAPSCVR